MIEGIHNGEWIEAKVPQTDIDEIAEYFQVVNGLKSRADILKADINTVSQGIAPTTGSTPSLKASEYEGAGYANQGGCTDGTYIYYYIKAQSDANAGTFVKMNRSNYAVESGNTKSMSLYHGNDMTYNPDTGYIYVATTYQSGASSKIAVIDPSALSIVAEKYVPFYISAIAYEPNRKVFIGGFGSLTKYVFKLNENDDFELMRTITVTKSDSLSAGYDSQSITCDSAFIYHAWSSPPSMNIEIFNWLGDYVGTISKNVKSGDVSMEIEFIDKISKDGLLMGMYGAGLGSNSPAYIYTMTLS